MNLYSSCNLFADSRMVSVVDSLTAPVSLINTLVVSLCVRRHAELSETLGALEQAWTGYRMEEIDEMTSRDLAVPYPTTTTSLRRRLFSRI